MMKIPGDFARDYYNDSGISGKKLYDRA